MNIEATSNGGVPLAEPTANGGGPAPGANADDAYEAGRDAYAEGLEFDECGLTGGRARADWLDGWRDARDEDAVEPHPGDRWDGPDDDHDRREAAWQAAEHAYECRIYGERERW